MPALHLMKLITGYDSNVLIQDENFFNEDSDEDSNEEEEEK